MTNDFAASDPGGTPKVAYTHQEFPRLVYDHKKSKASRVIVRELPDGRNIEDHVLPVIVCKEVRDAEELKEALAAGFKLEAAEQHPSAELPGCDEGEEGQGKGRKAKEK